MNAIRKRHIFDSKNIKRLEFQDIVMGFLNVKERNDRYTAKKINENRVENNNELSIQQKVIENNDESENSEQDVQILKATVVNDASSLEIHSKLKSTLSYRTKMLENRSLDLLELFPYFFTNPSLVREEKTTFFAQIVIICIFSDTI